jgi:hypothetical protein
MVRAVTFPERLLRRVRFMRLRLGSARTWRITLGVLVLLSLAAAVSLTLMSHQFGDGVIALFNPSDDGSSTPWTGAPTGPGTTPSRW